MLSRTLSVLVLALALAGSHVAAQGHDHAAMAMGFDQKATVHHFHLFTDGGAIDVSARSATDLASRDAIRRHLAHIAQRFGDGDFALPMIVHDRDDVPGTAGMASRKDRIQYRYADTPQGGRVDIVTTDPAALEAVHQFLAFQIRDHGTGDSLAPGRR